MILAIDDEHHRAFIDGVAGLGADAGLPILGEEGLERGDLLLEGEGRVPSRHRLVPGQGARAPAISPRAKGSA